MTERTDGGLDAQRLLVLPPSGDDLTAEPSRGGALRSGTQEMVVTSTSPLVGIEPALGGVRGLPFLVRGWGG